MKRLLHCPFKDVVKTKRGLAGSGFVSVTPHNTVREMRAVIYLKFS